MESRTASGLAVIEHRASDAVPVVPNDNDPATHPPGTVGPPTAVPGDPDGLVLIDEGPPPPPWPRSTLTASPWSGWPADWATPNLWGRVNALTDTAWLCLDLNSSILATMPPYIVDPAPSLRAGWLTNPDPDMYTSWAEFFKQFAWDFQLGEAFVVCTARYDGGDGWPARFHVVAPWQVEVEIGNDGFRHYRIGNQPVPVGDILHVRYTSTTGDAHGHGPLEAGAARVIAARALLRYASTLASGGGIPSSVLKSPRHLNDTQARDLQSKWVESRMSSMGLPAVLSGGLEFETLSFSPKDLALVELSAWTEARIAVLLGVPPFLAGLPSGGDSLTYSNVNSLFDYHWRAGLRPKATVLMQAMSAWALPRGTDVELNRDAYVQPGPYERAQTWQILVGLGVVSAEQVAEIERYSDPIRSRGGVEL